MPRKPKKTDVPSAIATLITSLVEERRDAYHNLYNIINEIESWKRSVKKARAAVEEAKAIPAQSTDNDTKSKTKAKKSEEKPADTESVTNQKLIKAEDDLQRAIEEVQTREQKVKEAKDRYDKLNFILHRVYEIDSDYTDIDTFRNLVS